MLSRILKVFLIFFNKSLWERDFVLHLHCQLITTKKKIMENTITKFETGSIYEMRFIGDSNLKVPFICVKRTEKMVTFEKFQGTEVVRKKISIWDNSEMINYATYSMAPTIRAKNIIG